jgi:phosphoglycolate phosphatase
MRDIDPPLPSVGVDRIPETLILWDVDHTLIENGGVSKETYSLAFEQLMGRAPAAPPKTDGRTDFQVMRELFADNPPPASQEMSDFEIEAALASAIEGVSPGLLDRGYVLPGAEEALARLSEVATVIQSVLTGNIERNAQVKLNTFRLDRFIDLEVGGYGSDNIVRSKLVDIAREKTFRKYGVRFGRSSTVIIGDTVRDVQTAHEGDAKIIAVASGITNEATLADAGADKVVPSLADTDAFLSMLVEVRISE